MSPVVRYPTTWRTFRLMSPKFRTHTSLKTGRVRRQITPSPLAFLLRRRLIIGLLLLFLIILFVCAWSQEAGYIGLLADVTPPYWGKDYDNAKAQRGK